MGSSWKASPSIAPMEHPNQDQEQQASQTQTWGQFFSASFLGGSGPEHDTDDDEDETVTGEGCGMVMVRHKGTLEVEKKGGRILKLRQLSVRCRSRSGREHGVQGYRCDF